MRGSTPYPLVLFEDSKVSQRSLELETQEARTAARDWLQDRGLLADLPIYDPTRENLSAFGRRMEKYCGYEPGDLLIQYAPELLTVRLDWAERQLQQSAPSRQDAAKFECMMNAMSASNLEDHRARFGFIGNEVYEEAPVTSSPPRGR
jgi:hypothetical protein